MTTTHITHNRQSGHDSQSDLQEKELINLFDINSWLPVLSCRWRTQLRQLINFLVGGRGKSLFPRNSALFSSSLFSLLFPLLSAHSDSSLPSIPLSLSFCPLTLFVDACLLLPSYLYFTFLILTDSFFSQRKEKTHTNIRSLACSTVCCTTYCSIEAVEDKAFSTTHLLSQG